MAAVCIALGQVIGARYRGKMAFWDAERRSTINKRGDMKEIKKQKGLNVGKFGIMCVISFYTDAIKSKYRQSNL